MKIRMKPVPWDTASFSCHKQDNHAGNNGYDPCNIQQTLTHNTSRRGRFLWTVKHSNMSGPEDSNWKCHILWVLVVAVEADSAWSWLGMRLAYWCHRGPQSHCCSGACTQNHSSPSWDPKSSSQSSSPCHPPIHNPQSVQHDLGKLNKGQWRYPARYKNQCIIGLVITNAGSNFIFIWRPLLRIFCC